MFEGNAAMQRALWPEGASVNPFGRPTSHARGMAVDWNPDNTKEFELGILRSASDLDQLARELPAQASFVGHAVCKCLLPWQITLGGK